MRATKLKISRAFLLGALTLVTTGASHSGDLPLLSGGELSALRVVKTERYGGRALYGYIDGGAELYREYGFVRLAVQQLDYGGEELTAEIYQMTDTLAAFGIFSVHRFDAGAVDLLGAASCSTAYHAQFAAAEFFIRVVNTTGTPRASSATLSVARVLRSKVSPPSSSVSALPSPILWALCPDIRSHSYFRGALGLQNGLPDWSDLVEGIDRFEMYLAKAQGAGATIADLRLGDPSDKSRFIKRWKDAGDQARTCWEIGESRLILLEGGQASDSLLSAVSAAVTRAGRNR